MVPTLEGEFARKRRMMVGLWDIVVGEGMLSPRGYPPLFAFELASHRLLRYLSPVPPPGRSSSPTSPCSARAGSTSLTFARPAGAARRGRCSAAAVPLAPLRIARYYVMTTASIAAGLWDRCAPRRRRALGEGRGDALMPRAARPPDRRRSPWSCSRPSCWPPRSRSSSAAAARSSTASAGSAAAAREFEMLKLRTMVAGSDPVGVGTVVTRDDPRVTARRPLPAPHLARRGPQPGQRPPRRDGDRRPAPDDPGPGRRLHPAPAPPPRGPARDHRLGPGPGPRRHPLGGADRARRLVRRPPLRRPRRCASSPRPSGWCSPARASPPTEGRVLADEGPT